MLVFLWIAAALCHIVASNSVFRQVHVGLKSPDIVYKIGDMSKIPVTEPIIKDALSDSPASKIDLPIEDIDGQYNCRYLNGVFQIGKCIGSRYYIIHEIGHFLGFYHTYTRPARNNYFRVRPEAEGWFKNLACPDCYSSPVVPFDYGSGMHQRLTNGVDLVDEAYNSTLGQSVRFPFSDYHSMNWLFNCSGKCAIQPKCENGGYTHPRDCNKCMCNKFYTGDFCETPRNLVKLSCTDKPVHVWSLDHWADETLPEPKLGDDFQDRGENLWDLIETPANLKMQIEVETFATRWARTAECGPFAVEINDGDFNLVGRMFCDGGNVYPRIVHNFTARSQLVGLHAEYPLEHTAFLKAKFTLLGCDGAQVITSTATAEVPSSTTKPPEDPSTTKSTSATSQEPDTTSTATTQEPDTTSTATTREPDTPSTATTQEPATTTTTTTLDPEIPSTEMSLKTISKFLHDEIIQINEASHLPRPRDTPLYYWKIEKETDSGRVNQTTTFHELYMIKTECLREENKIINAVTINECSALKKEYGKPTTEYIWMYIEDLGGNVKYTDAQYGK